MIQPNSQQNSPTIASTYWISGSEPILLNSTCDKIRDQVKAAGFSERLIFYDEPSIDWMQVQFHLDNLSLFAEKKLIEIRLKTAKIATAGLDVIKQHMNQSANDHCHVILIISPKLEQKTLKTKWFSALSRNLNHIATRTLTPREFVHWIKQQFEMENYQVNHATCQQLATLFENDLLSAKQAIDIIKLQALDKSITTQHLNSIGKHAVKGSIFELIDAALAGDAAKSIALLQTSQQEGNEPLLIVSLLARQIRQLHQLSELCTKQSFQSAASKLGIWQKRQFPVKKALQHLSQKKILSLHQQLNQIDQGVKGMITLNVWASLERVLLQLSGKL